MGVFDSEGRANLGKHHFLGMELDLGGGFAPAVGFADLCCAVGNVVAQYISRNVKDSAMSDILR